MGDSSQAVILTNFIRAVKEIEQRFAAGQDDYALEFLKIRVESDDLRELDEFKSVVGARAENFRKNRYRDILPFDYSRVTIDTKPSRCDCGDYINASFINGANDKVAYIATQGPLKETLADFWQMLYQYEVNIIIMLCDLIESGKPKCEQYWPDSSAKLKFGDLRITLGSEVKENDHFVIRTLRMKRKGSSEKERIIFQFQYFGWPDHGTPDEVAPLVDFVDRIRDYQPEDQYSPLVVHCSAGCGRTGTICALDYVRTLLKAKRVPASFNVCSLVSELRKQRPAMVQSKEQYMLLHRAIALMFELELEKNGLNPLQVNVSDESLTSPLFNVFMSSSLSDVFVSSPPLTPAPPVPADNRCSPQFNILPAPPTSLSPTASSGTSCTSASDDGCNTSVDDQKNSVFVNGLSKETMGDHVTHTNVSYESIPERADSSSMTSYETVSTTKTDSHSAPEDEDRTHKNLMGPGEPESNGNAAGDNNGKLNADNHVDAIEPHSNSAATDSTAYSSHVITKANIGTMDNLPEFPHKLTEHPMGPKAQPSSWPEPEEMISGIQRL